MAAYWAATGADPATADGVRAITASHPALSGAVKAAGCHVAALADLHDGWLCARRELSPRQRAALRLANPWRVGSRPQIDATISLVDGLLTPRAGGSAFVRRQLLQPRHSLVRRDPRLRAASTARIGAARMAHAARVLTRYGIAAGGLLRPQTVRHTAR